MNPLILKQEIYEIKEKKETNSRPLKLHTSYNIFNNTKPTPEGIDKNEELKLDDITDNLSSFQIHEKSKIYKEIKVHRQHTATVRSYQAVVDELWKKDPEKLKQPQIFCYYCKKQITHGQVAIAMDKTWHVNHFLCTHCGIELAYQDFYECNNKAYCEKDYHDIFAPKCNYCNLPISEKCISAMGKEWHLDHFFCSKCNKQFDNDEGYYKKDNKPYCKDHYLELFEKCSKCCQPIIGNFVTAIDSKWHPECFVCSECQCHFVGGEFFEYQGRPYCEIHYQNNRNALCAECKRPIFGRCIIAMFRKFHPHHFLCSFCSKELNQASFKEYNDKPYCHRCFDKLYR